MFNSTPKSKYSFRSFRQKFSRSNDSDDSKDDKFKQRNRKMSKSVSCSERVRIFVFFQYSLFIGNFPYSR